LWAFLPPVKTQQSDAFLIIFQNSKNMGIFLENFQKLI